MTENNTTENNTETESATPAKNTIRNKMVSIRKSAVYTMYGVVAALSLSNAILAIDSFPWHVYMADMNKDGRADVVLTYMIKPTKIYLGQPDGSLENKFFFIEDKKAASDKLYDSIATHVRDSLNAYSKSIDQRVDSLTR